MYCTLWTTSANGYVHTFTVAAPRLFEKGGEEVAFIASFGVGAIVISVVVSVAFKTV